MTNKPDTNTLQKDGQFGSIQNSGTDNSTLLTLTKLTSGSIGSIHAVTLIPSSNGSTGAIILAWVVSAWLRGYSTHGPSVAMLASTPEESTAYYGTDAIVETGMGVAGATGVVSCPPGRCGWAKDNCRKNIVLELLMI